MNLLVLKGFNNYFNRKIKKYSDLEEYEALASSYTNLTDINFNPADGVRTQLVLGKGQLSQFFDFEEMSCPDYLICYDEDLNIKSRWFITDVDRTRGGQYKMSLKRDSIVDNFNTLLNCPAYILKGVVSDDSPYILNNEGISVNQILKNREPLYDDTGSAWLVGYMAKEFGVDNTVSVQIEAENIKYKSIEDIATELGVSSTDLAASLTTNRNNPTYIVNDNIELVSWINYPDNTALEFKVISGSSNGMTSFSYDSCRLERHNPTTDCFCKCVEVPYSGTMSNTKLLAGYTNACNTNAAALRAQWPTIVGHPLFTRNVYTKLKNYADNNTLIYKAGTYYNIKIGSVTGPTNTGDLYFGNATVNPYALIAQSTISHYNQGIDPSTTTHLVDQNRGKMFFNYNELVVNFYLEEVTNSSLVPGINYTMSTTRNACKDQCFDMFAIPYGNIKIQDSHGNIIANGIGEASQELSVKLAQKIVLGNTTYQIYDLQLLPYCPFHTDDIMNYSKTAIQINKLTAAKDYDWIDQSGITVKETQTAYPEAEYDQEMYRWNAVKQFIFDIPYASVTASGGEVTGRGLDEVRSYSFSKQSYDGGNKTRISFWADIDYEQTADNIQATAWVEYTSNQTEHKSIVLYPKSASFTQTIRKSVALQDEMKLEANCNNYRLVSPNYQGSFDFNVAKNGGVVDHFTANCTYKPYTPYIRVVPYFAGIYGTNQDKECRGLICGGDFSLGVINSAWETYQLQNKNYQNIFNREIQSMDISQEITRTQQYASGAINILSSGVSGASSGAMAGSAGGPYGLAIGAAVGGTVGLASSGAGYAADINLMDRQLVEQRQLSLDKFSLQLGNIQALPYTLTKVGSFDIDSTGVPMLEYYTCTPEEKQAFRNKITYEGMTLGIVDILAQYLSNPGYLQAELIRNEELVDDNHMLEDIYVELRKGVYL